jgi:predicted RNase H-like HicB family nuclease
MTTKTKAQILKFCVKIVVEEDTTGYHAYAPALKGLHMGGDTPDEALANAREAASLFLQVMIEDGDPIPIDVIKPKVIRKIPNHEGIVSSGLEEIVVNLQ